MYTYNGRRRKRKNSVIYIHISYIYVCIEESQYQYAKPPMIPLKCTSQHLMSLSKNARPSSPRYMYCTAHVYSCKYLGYSEIPSRSRAIIAICALFAASATRLKSCRNVAVVFCPQPAGCEEYCDAGWGALGTSCC